MQTLEKVLELRKARNWTEHRLSEEANIAQSTVLSWYKKDILPSIFPLEKISNAFEMILS